MSLTSFSISHYVSRRNSSRTQDAPRAGEKGLPGLMIFVVVWMRNVPHRLA